MASFSDTPKDDDGKPKEPTGGGAGNAPKEKRPTQGYGRSKGKTGPGRKPGKPSTGKGGKH